MEYICENHNLGLWLNEESTKAAVTQKSFYMTSSQLYKDQVHCNFSETDIKRDEFWGEKKKKKLQQPNHFRKIQLQRLKKKVKFCCQG